MANQVAYGFFSLKDVFSKRVTEVGVSVVAEAIQASIAEHQRQMDALVGLFATPTTDFKIKYRTPSAARLSALDENGRARPIRLNEGSYELAFPLQMGGAAWGGNWLARSKMTIAEANEATLSLISADVRWMRDHILSALFTNVDWTFNDDDRGALTVKGLANADAVVYLIQTGADAPATDNHYLAQAAAISSGANPLPAIYDELKEHPENGGEVVVLLPTNQRTAVEGLSGFKESPDPNIRLGANTDQLIGALGLRVPGEVIGYADKCWLAEWRSLPNDYLVAFTTQGPRALNMREDAESDLRGFRQVATRDNHPFFESQWVRRAGFGAFNRVGAVVQRIGNAAYAIPTNYAAPMP